MRGTPAIDAKTGIAVAAVLVVLGALLFIGTRNEDPAPVTAAASTSAEAPISSSSASASTSTTATPTPAPASTTTAVPVPAGPPVNGTDLATPPAVPWTAPPAPPATTGPADPGLAALAAPVPAELASPAGRAAYGFVLAWSQAYLARVDWQAEWTARWSPYATGELRGQARQAAAGVWTFATESATSAGLNVYSPTVVRVLAGTTNDTTSAEFDISVARQTAFIGTNSTDPTMSQIVTWRVIVLAKPAGWQVETVFDLTGGEGD